MNVVGHGPAWSESEPSSERRFVEEFIISQTSQPSLVGKKWMFSKLMVMMMMTET